MGPALAADTTHHSDMTEFRKYLRQIYDVVGVEELEAELRSRISEYLLMQFSVSGRKRKGSYNLLSEQTDISHTFIWKFHTKDQAICITNMNKLANFFGVRYIVDNF